MTSRTKSGTSAGLAAAASPSAAAGKSAATSGSSTLARPARAASMAAKLRSTTAWPRRPYVFSTAPLISAMAWSAGSMSVSAKKHTCSTVLVRFPSLACEAMRAASMTHSLMSRSAIWRCTFGGSRSHTSSGPYGLFSRKVAPRRAASSTSTRSSCPNSWHATKSASLIR